MTSTPTPLRLLLLCLACAMACALGELDAALVLPACLLTAVIAGAGVRVLGRAALVGGLPAMALLPGGSWLALGGWTVAAAAAGAAQCAFTQMASGDRLRDLHNELRDAERERELLRNTIERYPVLLEACLELSSARDLDWLAGALCRRARQLLPDARQILVFMGSATRQTCRASAGANDAPCPRQAGAEELYVAAEARSLTFRHDDMLSVYIPLRADRRQGDGSQVSRGVLAVSLIADQVGKRLSLDLLQALGRLGGMGLATVDLVTQARSLALRDDLTGLYGQHEFLRRIDEQVAHARRYRHPLGVLMCDMDHLKRYNDQWGHPAGDQALKMVARAITSCLTAGAIACRYGGEEFAILIPSLDQDKVRALAERIRTTIASVEADPAHPERTLTASIGYAMLMPDENGRAALDRADAACYRAKAAGRNRSEAA